MEDLLLKETQEYKGKTLLKDLIVQMILLLKKIDLSLHLPHYLMETIMIILKVKVEMVTKILI